jgi:hypothetical protein
MCFWLTEPFLNALDMRLSSNNKNCIDDVIVSVLTSSAVDRGFEPRSGQTKDNKIGMYCFSAK